MIKSKKGFTLIELLAVIVILAIIALIATPIVLNIISDTKSESSLRNADFYLEALELSIAQATLDEKNITDGTYNVLESGNICLEGLVSGKCPEGKELEVEVKGKVPSGTVTITNGEISEVLLALDNKEIYKNSKGELVYAKTLEEVCELQDGYTAKTAGAKYLCKVDPNKDPYTFYVLTTPTSTDTRINLIMDRNICSDGTLATAENKCLVAWTSMEYLKEHAPQEDWDNDENFNIYGPVTAMEHLSKATSSWTNTNEMKIDKFNSDAGATFDMLVYNTYARMPYYSEVADSNGTNEYLYENLEGSGWYGTEGKQPTNNISKIYGYWTLSSSAGDSSYAWWVDYCGYVYSDGVGYDGGIGACPVINLKI